jgi:hypothetical protein
MADLRKTAVSPHTMQGAPAQAPRGLAQTALDPLRRAYEAYQRSIGQPFQQAVRGGVRGYFGLPMMSDASATGREAYRQGEALGYTPGVGMPAGAVRMAAEGVQALPSIAGEIGRVISAMPSGAGAAQAEDFARYQRSIPPSDVSPLTAYHGTPHRFEPTPANPLGEFRAAAIGSGEGAQAYGYGTYFAEAPGVAKGYQTTLAYKAFDVGPEAEKLGIKLSAGARGEFIRQAAGNTDPSKAARRLQNANIGARSIPKEKLEELFKGYYERGGGNFYTVDIPDEMIGKMLDWDKPLSEQPASLKPLLAEIEKVGSVAAEKIRTLATQPGVANWAKQDLLKDAAQIQNSKSPAHVAGVLKRMQLDYGISPDSGPFAPVANDFLFFVKGMQAVPNMDTGGGAVSYLQARYGERAASEMLRQAGIPGIRYLDAGSRGGPDRTRNIVVFPGEESKVKILKRD